MFTNKHVNSCSVSGIESLNENYTISNGSSQQWQWAREQSALAVGPMPMVYRGRGGVMVEALSLRPEFRGFR